MSDEAYIRGAGYKMRTVGTPEPEESRSQLEKERDELRSLLVRCEHVITTMHGVIATDRPELLRAPQDVKLENILWQVDESMLLKNIAETLHDIKRRVTSDRVY